jgi:hypothetical protein
LIDPENFGDLIKRRILFKLFNSFEEIDATVPTPLRFNRHPSKKAVPHTTNST